MEQWYPPYIMSVSLLQIKTLYYLLPFRPGKNCWNHQEEGNHFTSQTGQPRTFFASILKAHGDSWGAAMGAGQMPAWKNNPVRSPRCQITLTTDLPHHILSMNLTAHGITQVPLFLMIHLTFSLFFTGSKAFWQVSISLSFFSGDLLPSE